MDVNMKKRSLRLLFLIMLLLHVFILVQGSLPATESAAESYAVLVFLGVVFPFLTHNLLRKLAHFFLYGLLGSLHTMLWSRLRRRALPFPLLTVLPFAALDETIQYFVPGRHGSVWDVLLDMAGALTGALIVLLVQKCLKRRT